VVAYAAADVVHELLGHAVAAKLVGVTALSISSVALQTAEPSRAVAAAGTIANVVSGAVVFASLPRNSPLDGRHYFMWLFAFVSMMNGGYLVASGVLDIGDWAVVIDGLKPAWTWRVGLVAAGVALYTLAVRAAARAPIGWVAMRGVPVEEIRRLTIWSYVAGGGLLVLASALNPIGPAIILVSGVAASFGLTWALLMIPGIVAGHAVKGPATASVLEFDRAWAALGFVVAVLFVGVLGPGIRLS
jgi:hypothetical protein